MNNVYELYHHGVKGQKWGVRRYQNPDGSLTSAGKKHKSSMTSEQKKKIGKAIAGTALAAASVTALAIYAKKNPEKILQAELLAKGMSIKTKELSKKGIDKGKAYIKEVGSNAWEGTKEGVKSVPSSLKSGIKEGFKEAPKKVGKAIVVGAGLNLAKKALDKTVGSEESAKIFQANDPKKIGKFWKVQKNDED